ALRSLLFIVFTSIASSRVRIVPAVLAVSVDRRDHHRNYEGSAQRLAHLCRKTAYKCARDAAPPGAHGSSRNRQQRALESCVPPLVCRFSPPEGIRMILAGPPESLIPLLGILR